MDKLFVTLYVLQLTAADKLAAKVEKVRARHEAGQGTLEYVAMFAVAAIIIAAVVGAINAAKLGEWATGIINGVKNAVKPG